MNESEQAAKLVALRNAYRAIFEGSDRRLTRAAERVLGDLAGICHFTSSVAAPGLPWTPEQLQVAEGKRQVYLHIVGMLRAEDRDLWELAANIKRWREETDPLSTEDR